MVRIVPKKIAPVYQTVPKNPQPLKLDDAPQTNTTPAGTTTSKIVPTTTVRRRGGCRSCGGGRRVKK